MLGILHLYKEVNKNKKIRLTALDSSGSQLAMTKKRACLSKLQTQLPTTTPDE